MVTHLGVVTNTPACKILYKRYVIYMIYVLLTRCFYKLVYTVHLTKNCVTFNTLPCRPELTQFCVSQCKIL